MVEDIKQLWQQHESAPIPTGWRSIVVDGVNLTSLHCEVAGNILTFITTGGRLTPNRIERLRDRSKTLEKSIEVLNGEAKNYFSNLKKISDIVIERNPF